MSKIFQNPLILLIFILFCEVFPQSTGGMRKSLADDKTGQTYNNFRTDSTEAVFYQVLKSGEFMYREPKNNADAVYTLDADMFVEYAGQFEGDNFMKIRVLDKFHGIIEGWVRPSVLNDSKYFGRPFKESKNNIRPKEFDKKINPHWIKNEIQVVYIDSSLSGTAAATLKKGDLVFVENMTAENNFPVYYANKEGGFSRGFINKESVSEFAIIENASADLDLLFKKYDPVLLKNDIDKAAFISYSGINFYNRDAKEFTEDKLCREKTPDTLSYRYTISSNIDKIKKIVAVKNKFEKTGIAMYRFLPDENVITRRDTVKCHVLEYVSVPKSAKIVAGGVEEVSVANTITKLYISHLDNFNMDIVFHRETTAYEWLYSKNIQTGETVKSNTNIEKVVKRMVAFRKH